MRREPGRVEAQSSCSVGTTDHGSVHEEVLPPRRVCACTATAPCCSCSHISSPGTPRLAAPHASSAAPTRWEHAAHRQDTRCCHSARFVELQATCDPSCTPTAPSSSYRNIQWLGSGLHTKLHARASPPSFAWWALSAFARIQGTRCHGSKRCRRWLPRCVPTCTASDTWFCCWCTSWTGAFRLAPSRGPAIAPESPFAFQQRTAGTSSSGSKHWPEWHAICGHARTPTGPSSCCSNRSLPDTTRFCPQHGPGGASATGPSRPSRAQS